MCKRNEIECFLTPKCKKLCVAASEWADQDYVYQDAIPLPPGKLEVISAGYALLMPNGTRYSMVMPVPLEILTPKQREAVDLVFLSGDQERPNYRNLASELGVCKNAAFRRIASAVKKLRKSMGRNPMCKGKISKALTSAV